MLGLSDAEKLFIVDGVAQEIRNDGRHSTSYRPISVETGVLLQSNGSARVCVGITDVLVGVTFDVVRPSADVPRRGLLQCSVECAPGSPVDDVGLFNAELGAALQRCLAGGNALALDALCIEPGRFVWLIHVDAVVSSFGGNLLDVLCLATRAALFNARLPKVHTTPREDSGDLELEVDADVLAGELLDLTRMPIAVTLTRIGNNFVVDATREEEACAAGSLTVAVNAGGCTCGVEKGGAAALDAATSFAMLHAAVQIGQRLIGAVDKVLLQERTMHRRPVAYLATR